MSNRFRCPEYTMSGIAGYLKRRHLELQILSINILGLIGSTLSWQRWDRQLGKIWNLPDSRLDELDDWTKTILSHIVVARFIINYASFLAHVANIYTILTRNRQNLLVLWMVLSFVRDILLEIVVIIIAFSLWRKGNVSTSLLVEFILEKTIWLAVSIYKWYATLKWYTHLRTVAKIRVFAINARASIAKVARSLDDECLDVATARRVRYASLLNLDPEPLAARASVDRASYELLRTSKSPTTLVAVNDGNDTDRDANDRDPIANELSLAEKSMRMLSITAEDVMDARARIQERSYWAEQEEAAKTPGSTEEMVARFSPEKDAQEGTYDATARNGRTNATDDDVGAIAASASRLADVAGEHSLSGKKEKTERDEIASLGGQREILTERRREAADVSATRNGGIESSAEAKDRARGAAESRDSRAASGKEGDEREEARTAAKIVQCPSGERSARRSASEASPYFVLFRRMIAGLHSARAGHLADRSSPGIETIDRARGYRGRVAATTVIAIASRGSLEETRPETSSPDTCRCTSRVYIKARASDEEVEDDVERAGEFGGRAPRGRSDESSSARGRSERSRPGSDAGQARISRGLAWDSVSLALVARSSGYEVRGGEATFYVPKDSAGGERGRARQIVQRMQHGRTFEPRSIHDAMSRRIRNYTEECDAVRGERVSLRIRNDLVSPEDKKGTSGRRKRDLSTTIRRLTIDERETFDSRALRAYNELTLLGRKEELEARRRRDASIREEQLTTEGKDDSPKRASRLEEEAAACPPGETNGGREIIEPSAPTRRDADDEEDGRRTRVSLNLRAITRSIEWTPHPRGIVLINKSLHGEPAHVDGGRQRDIVDDNVAGALHGALHFKPAIVATILRRSQTARIDESSAARFSTCCTRESRPDAFVCRVSDDGAVSGRDWSLLDLERGIADDEDRAIAGGREEDGRYLRIILPGEPGQTTASESRSATLEVVDAGSSFDDVDTTGVPALDGRDDDDGANDDELSVRFIIDVLRNLGVAAVSSAPDDVPIDERYGDPSNAMTGDESSIGASDGSIDEGRNSPTRSNRSDNVPSPVDSRDEEYPNATDAEDEETHERKCSPAEITDGSATSRSSNREDNTDDRRLNDKIDGSILDRALENPSKLSLPGPPSFVESSTLTPSDERLARFTRFSDSQIVSADGREKSVSTLRIESSENLSARFPVNGEISGSEEDAAQGGVRNDDGSEDIYGTANEFSAGRSWMNSGLELSLRDDSFDSAYERRDDGAETPISLEEASSMEEFSDDVSARDSAHSQ